PAGVLRFPVGGERSSGAARVQDFQSGSIWWTSAGGAHAVRGAIGNYWLSTGGVDGPLGAPTGDETPAGPDSAQAFRNGVLHWSAVSSVHRMTQQLLDAYVANGASTGPLGAPVSDVYVRDGRQRVDLAHGALVVVDGVVQVQPA
ncbi:LGFP repeat-containing protein, partial [Geodermatophilus sp. SYSU D00698]